MSDPAATSPLPSGRGVAALVARKAGSLTLRLRALLGRGGLPNAIIVGAMKSGTTSLFDYLVQHPQVCGSRTKELHFFDNQFDKGVRWYRANFTPRGEPVLLESSPYYLFHPLAAERAARLVPAAKLIVLLRNPVDRAYSHYNQNAEEGLEPLSFEEAVDREAERLAGTEDALARGEIARSHAHQTFSYVAKGRYAQQLRRWLEHFPREQLLILRAEDFFRSPQDGVDRVTDFLGLERFALPDATPGNQRRYPLMHPETRRRLEEVFQASNEELRGLTGISWPPSGAALEPAEIDLQSPHLLRAPWEGYDAVRQHGPAVWLPRQKFWLVVGHAEVREALERPETFSSAPYRGFDPVLAGADPPHHARGRALAAMVLDETDSAIAAALREAEARLSAELDDIDAVSGFAAPVARAATASLLGIAPSALPVTGSYDALCAELAAAAPQAEAYGRWIHAGAAPGEAASLFRAIWLASETMLGRSIGWTAFELMQAPEMHEAVAADPASLEAFFDEVLRLHPPSHMAARRTTAAARLGGTTIAAGAEVRLCFAGANRDPAVFEEPHRLNVGRERRPHLSFGAGPHGCIGEALARRIVPAVARRLLQAGPESGPGEARFLAAIDALTPASLPLRLRKPQAS